MDKFRCNLRINIMLYVLYIIITSIVSCIIPLISIFNNKLNSRKKNEQNQYKIALTKIQSNSKKIICQHIFQNLVKSPVLNILNIIWKFMALVKLVKIKFDKNISLKILI